MFEQPLVSVVIPAYNASLYIEETLQSVFRQNYVHKEIIVVNDGSTDNTIDALKRHEASIHIIDQDNRGVASARNAGMRVARGKYIAFLDSDDVWLPGKLSSQVRYMEANPSVRVTYGLFDRCYQNPGQSLDIEKIFNDYSHLEHYNLIEPIRLWSGWVYSKMLFESLPSSITIAMTSSLISEAGYFDETLVRGEDYDYWIRLSRITQFHKLNQKMAIYRLHGKNITAQCMPINTELHVLEKAVAHWGYKDIDGSTIDKKKIHRRFSRLHFDFGYEQFWRGDSKIALKSFIESSKYSPRFVKNYLYIALSCLSIMRGPR